MSTNNLPPIPQDRLEENPRWREWFRNLGSYITAVQFGTTVLPISSGGTGAGSAGAARFNLGVGSLGTQNSTAISVTGGTLTGVTIPYTCITGLATVAHTGVYSDLTGTPTGVTGTITTAKLTALGSNGSMTFTNGILTAQTAAT